MDNILFFKSFRFMTISHSRHTHTDNSYGIDKHFIARIHSGTGRIATLNGEEINVKKGDIFYLPMGLRYHSYWTPDSESGKVEWESYGFTYFPDNESKSFCMQLLIPNESSAKLLDELEKDMSVSVASVGLLYSFLGRVMPEMERADLDKSALLFQKATEYINANPDLKVSELAKHCGMSESALYSFFKAYADITPIGMKNSLLIKKAIALLGSTDLYIEEISDRLGFCSVAYFRKVFKDVTDKTPTQVRREQVAKYKL